MSQQISFFDYQKDSYNDYKYIRLNNSLHIPRTGAGFLQWQGKDLPNFVVELIKGGYRLFDTAKFYGNEKEIGEGINKAIQLGLVQRNEIFIQTQIWNDGKVDPETMLKTLLKDLNLTYVDLFLIDWPMGKMTEKFETAQLPLHELWKRVEKCVSDGLCRSIGVANFGVQLLLDLFSYAKVRPAIIQTEVHPYYTNEDLIKFCQMNGVVVEAYSPLANPKEMGWHKSLLEDPVILDLAVRYQRKPSQIVLNWALSRNLVPIVKIELVEQIRENLGIFDFKMEEEHLKKISNLNQDFKIWDQQKMKDLPLTSKAEYIKQPQVQQFGQALHQVGQAQTQFGQPQPQVFYK